VLRSFRVLIAVLAVASVFTAMAAACAAAATDGQEMACCQSIHQDCGHAGDAADCCGNASFSQQITIAKLDPRSAPIRALPPAVSLSQSPIVVSASVLFALDAPTAHARDACSPPPYIAFSALLI
jgi:hypothetical protein